MKIPCVLLMALLFGRASTFSRNACYARLERVVPTTAAAGVSSPFSQVNPQLASKPSATLLCSSTPEGGNNGGEVVMNRDFRVAGIFLTLGFLLDTLPLLKFTLGPLITALGVLFLVQTFRLSFVCDDDSFSLQNTAKESGENVIVGGENKWNYASFVNYDFFPKGWIDQPQGPILVYFKETQTPSDKWSEGPGQKANSEEALANGAVPGQVHFFPAICDSKQLRDEWAKRGCRKL